MSPGGLQFRRRLDIGVVELVEAENRQDVRRLVLCVRQTVAGYLHNRHNCVSAVPGLFWHCAMLSLAQRLRSSCIQTIRRRHSRYPLQRAWHPFYRAASIDPLARPTSGTPRY